MQAHLEERAPATRSTPLSSGLPPAQPKTDSGMQWQWGRRGRGAGQGHPQYQPAPLGGGVPLRLLSYGLLRWPLSPAPSSFLSLSTPHCLSPRDAPDLRQLSQRNINTMFIIHVSHTERKL